MDVTTSIYIDVVTLELFMPRYMPIAHQLTLEHCMSRFIDGGFSSRADLRSFLTHLCTKEAKAYKKALKKCGASEEQLSCLEAFTGEGHRLSIATDADLAVVQFSYEVMWRAFLQGRDADPRLEYGFRRYMLGDAQFQHLKRDDLRGLKRSLESQLKREYDGHIGKFFVTPVEAKLQYGVNVILMRRSGPPVPSGGPRGIRRPKPNGAFTASDVLAFSSSGRDIASFIAEFWAPAERICGVNERAERSEPEKSADRALLVNALVVRGLMPLDRVCFGHGPGKSMTRHVLAEIKANTASQDIFKRSPLQPESVTRFLASLPTDEDGTPPALPSLILP